MLQCAARMQVRPLCVLYCKSAHSQRSGTLGRHPRLYTMTWGCDPESTQCHDGKTLKLPGPHLSHLSWHLIGWLHGTGATVLGGGGTCSKSKSVYSRRRSCSQMPYCLVNVTGKIQRPPWDGSFAALICHSAPPLDTDIHVIPFFLPPQSDSRPSTISLSLSLKCELD